MESKTTHYLSRLIAEFETKLLALRPQLKSVKWSSKFYEDISLDIEDFYMDKPDLKEQLINNYLKEKTGNRDEKFGVSDTTIRRIVNHEYDIIEPIHDARRHKLNIISVYLNFMDWEDFKRASRHILDIKHEELTQHIENALAAKYGAYASISNSNTDKLNDFFSGQTLANIIKVIKYIAKKNCKYDTYDVWQSYEILNIVWFPKYTKITVHESCYCTWGRKPKYRFSNWFAKQFSKKMENKDALNEDTYIKTKSIESNLLRIYYCEKLNGKWEIIRTQLIYKYFSRKDRILEVLFSSYPLCPNPITRLSLKLSFLLNSVSRRKIFGRTIHF